MHQGHGPLWISQLRQECPRAAQTERCALRASKGIGDQPTLIT